MRPFVLLGMLALTTACNHAFAARWPIGPTSTHGDSALGPVALTTRTVIGKVPPATLVAVDSTRCVVSASRYASVKVGEDLACSWALGSGLPPR